MTEKVPSAATSIASTSGGGATAPATRLEAAELDEHAAPVRLDEPAAPIRQRVDERRAVAERLARDTVDRALELLVADEHVAVNLVARAAADRIMWMVPQQVAPGELQVGVRERAAVAEGA